VSNPNENDDKVQDALRATGPGADLISDAEKVADLLLNETPTVAKPDPVRIPPPITPRRTPSITPPTTPEAKVAADVVGKPLTNDQIAQLIAALPQDQMEEFTKRVAAETRRLNSEDKAEKAKPKYITDFATIQERDIFDLRVPIEAISHEIPEFLIVNLKDPNYVPRWIQTNSRRLGQAHAEGWLYVTEADLATELKVEVEDDVSGHYVYADVVLMKMQKAKLYQRIRANFLKSLAVTKSQGAIHEAMSKIINQDLAQSSSDFKKYNESGAMKTYSPLVGA
jgi:hypothetical protein